MIIQRVGPYLRPRPNAATTLDGSLTWCYLLIDEGGFVVAIEWIS